MNVGNKLLKSATEFELDQLISACYVNVKKTLIAGLRVVLIVTYLEEQEE
jgi:hypothetical protein